MSTPERAAIDKGPRIQREEILYARVLAEDFARARSLMSVDSGPHVHAAGAETFRTQELSIPGQTPEAAVIIAVTQRNHSSRPYTV